MKFRANSLEEAKAIAAKKMDEFKEKYPYACGFRSKIVYRQTLLNDEYTVEFDAIPYVFRRNGMEGCR